MPTLLVAAARRTRALLPVLALSLGAPSCDSDAKPEQDSVTIGLLLPFTGSSSASGSNFERAVLYAADRINQEGGVQGRLVRVVSRDTHSDLNRSKKAAQQLVEAGASVVLGPESAEIALELLPLFRDRGVVFVSPVIGAAGVQDSDCTHPWYRLAPSADALGAALGKLMVAAGETRVAVLYADGAYDQAFGHAASERVRTLGGEVVYEARLDPGAQSYAASIAEVMGHEVHAVVVATSPRTAALLINEFQAAGEQLPRWFLSPLLKTDVFLQNVDPRAVEGAQGVAPTIQEPGGAFAREFAQRWQGDEPLDGAYFYYDAMGLLALALEQARFDAQGKAERDSLESALVAAAAPPGEAVSWNELELGLARLRRGEDMYYSGITGPMLLDRCGPRLLGLTSTWKIEAGAITQVASGP